MNVKVMENSNVNVDCNAWANLCLNSDGPKGHISKLLIQVSSRL